MLNADSENGANKFATGNFGGAIDEPKKEEPLNPF